jgi:phosphonate transport system ATP-binding protein
MLLIKDVHKSFGDHHVLRGISLRVDKGEFVAVIGASGCGKTTLIRSINGFVVPEKGSIVFNGEKVEYNSPHKLRKLRKKVGMIYQLFNLVERTSARHNVLCGCLGNLDTGTGFIKSLIGFFGIKEIEKARDLLGFVGMEDRLNTRADKLSGGQKQRVAIARALMQDPLLLLADEPIANLDPKTSTMIIELLKKINREKQLTIVTVIHHIDYVKSHFSRVIAMKDGVIVHDGPPQALDRDTLDYIYSGEEVEICTAA